MNKNRLWAIAIAAGFLCIGGYGLTTWLQGGQSTTIYDSETSKFKALVPHTPTSAEIKALMNHPSGAPAPPGFTIEDYGHVKAILTGYVDPITNESHVLVTVKDYIADIHEVTVKINSTIVAIANRITGGGIFDDRGQFTYVTISLMVNVNQFENSEVQWTDAQLNVEGRHLLGL